MGKNIPDESYNQNTNREIHPKNSADLQDLN